MIVKRVLMGCRRALSPIRNHETHGDVTAVVRVPDRILTVGLPNNWTSDLRAMLHAVDVGRVIVLDSMSQYADIHIIGGSVNRRPLALLANLDYEQPKERSIPGQSPRQDPYGPCNCESGKRYRKCCGRGRR